MRKLLALLALVASGVHAQSLTQIPGYNILCTPTSAASYPSACGTLPSAMLVPTTQLSGLLQAVQMPAFTGDVAKSSGSLATTVIGINGAAVPASAALVASNSSSQLTAVTLGTNLSITTGTLNAAGSGTPAFNTITSGSNTSATMTVGSGATLGASGSGTITATAMPASGLTSATNTTAAILMGTGGSLGPTGSGTVNANQVNGAAVATSAALIASNSSGQLIAGSGIGLLGSSNVWTNSNTFTSTLLNIANGSGGLAGIVWQGGGSTNNTINIPSVGGSHAGTVMVYVGTPTIVSSLPTCNSGTQDQWSVVTDATAPTYNGTLIGSGTVRVPVYCNGSAWSSH